MERERREAREADFPLNEVFLTHHSWVHWSTAGVHPRPPPSPPQDHECLSVPPTGPQPCSLPRLSSHPGLGEPVAFLRGTWRTSKLIWCTSTRHNNLLASHFFQPLDLSVLSPPFNLLSSLDLQTQKRLTTAAQLLLHEAHLWMVELLFPGACVNCDWVL